jgi:hypothetical protein
VDEARTVIRRLERIEALQSAEAPAQELLAEVRQLLSEGEAWLAAERGGARRGDGAGLAGARTGSADGAEAALQGCRAKLTRRKEATPETADSTSL